jgi:hypothetical protein
VPDAARFAEMIEVDGRDVWICPCSRVAASGLPSAWCPYCRTGIQWNEQAYRYVVQLSTVGSCLVRARRSKGVT